MLLFSGFKYKWKRDPINTFLYARKMPKVSFHLVSLYYLIEHRTRKQFFFFFEKLIGNECVSSREKNLRMFSWECKRAFNFIYSKLAVPMHLLLWLTQWYIKRSCTHVPSLTFLYHTFTIFFILSNYNFAFFILFPSWARHECFMPYYYYPHSVKHSFFRLPSPHRVFASFRLEKLPQSREIWE